MRHPVLGLSVLLACGACSSDPDVVAMSRATTGTLPGFGVSNCEEGLYKGAFSTVDADGGAQLELTGPMEFSLVKDERGGEFLRLGDTRLEGKESTLNAVFSALVETQECRAGSFQTTMTGEFSLVDSEGVKGLTVPFTGEIRGEYRSKEKVFYGEWSTVATTGELQGLWSAFLVKKPKPPQP